MKSSVEQIRARFDDDVERFSNLETGQTATMVGPLALELITQAAAATTPQARHALDIGCGAGNFTLKLLGTLPGLDVTLMDLSGPMLERAAQRVRPATPGAVVTVRGDIRDAPLSAGRFDVILAGAVFHHLRNDAEWRAVFAKCYAALRAGGSLWISDLIAHETGPVQGLMWRRYGEYLTGLNGDAYRDHVFAYIEQEDTPASLLYQVDVLRAVGFRAVEVLHKNGPFAAFGAVK
jgi:tRNA (cmo5U34)-methyltransferase